MNKFFTTALVAGLLLGSTITFTAVKTGGEGHADESTETRPAVNANRESADSKNEDEQPPIGANRDSASTHKAPEPTSVPSQAPEPIKEPKKEEGPVSAKTEPPVLSSAPTSQGVIAGGVPDAPKVLKTDYMARVSLPNVPRKVVSAPTAQQIKNAETVSPSAESTDSSGVENLGTVTITASANVSQVEAQITGWKKDVMNVSTSRQNASQQRFFRTRLVHSRKVVGQYANALRKPMPEIRRRGLMAGRNIVMARIRADEKLLSSLYRQVARHNAAIGAIQKVLKVHGALLRNHQYQIQSLEGQLSVLSLRVAALEGKKVGSSQSLWIPSSGNSVSTGWPMALNPDGTPMEKVFATTAGPSKTYGIQTGMLPAAPDTSANQLMKIIWGLGILLLLCVLVTKLNLAQPRKSQIAPSSASAPSTPSLHQRAKGGSALYRSGPYRIHRS